MDPATRQARLSTDRATTVFDARGFLDDLGLPSVLPVARMELAVSGMVSRQFKVRVSGGLNLPGMQPFSLTGIYFFGR